MSGVTYILVVSVVLSVLEDFHNIFSHPHKKCLNEVEPRKSDKATITVAHYNDHGV